jgi:putative membrane protein
MKLSSWAKELRAFDRVLLCFFWLISLIGMIAREDYTLFLRPQLVFLPAFSFLIFFAFFLVEMQRSDQPRIEPQGRGIRWLILISPVLFLTVARQATLGDAEFDQRWLGGEASMPATASRPPWMTSRSSPPTSSHERDLFGEIYWHPEPYHHQKVSVLGMVRRLPQITEMHGADAGLVYRFIMNCCVADAVPFAILLPEGLPPDASDGDWIHVQGKLIYEPTPPFNIMRIEGAAATPAPTPRNPYAF